MSLDVRAPRDARIALRASARQEQIIKAAAAATDRTLTDFVLETAVEQAEKVLADRRYFVFDDQQWAAFERLLDEPAPSMTKLASLLAADSIFSA